MTALVHFDVILCLYHSLVCAITVRLEFDQQLNLSAQIFQVKPVHK